MCQQCVDDGILTAEEYAEMKSGKTPEEVLSPEQIKKFDNRGYAIDVTDVDGLPDFLKRIMGGDAPEDPDEKAVKDMDKSVGLALDWFRRRLIDAGRHTKLDGESLDSPAVLDVALQTFAGELLYRAENMGSLAYTFMVTLYRYNALLEQWADLYVRAAGDPDEVGVNLDQATTPESKLAVTNLTGKTDPNSSADADHGTGFYL